MSDLQRALQPVTPPEEEPVSRLDARNHCRIDLPDDDAWLDRAISAARLWCEERSGRAFVTQTWRLWLNRFPEHGDRLGPFIEVPKPRLLSVPEIGYVDADGDGQVLDPSKYVVESRREPGLVVPARGSAWPYALETPGALNAVYVEFECGYGAASDVDSRAKQAILTLVAHWYRNRESVAIGVVSGEIAVSLSALLYQLWDGRMH